MVSSTFISYYNIFFKPGRTHPIAAAFSTLTGRIRVTVAEVGMEIPVTKVSLLKKI
jgi:hypothetical protein